MPVKVMFDPKAVLDEWVSHQYGGSAATYPALKRCVFFVDSDGGMNFFPVPDKDFYDNA